MSFRFTYATGIREFIDPLQTVIADVARRIANHPRREIELISSAS